MGSRALRRLAPAMASRTLSSTTLEAAPAAAPVETPAKFIKEMTPWEKFTTTIIDDQMDIKAIQNAQRAVETLEAACPIDQDDAFMTWLRDTFADKDATLDKVAFEARIDAVIAKLQSLQDDACAGEPTLFDHNRPSDEKLASSVRSMHYLYAKVKCQDIKRYFAQLDKDNDGVVASADVHTLLELYALGSPAQWLERHFAVLDSNRDGALSEAEMQQLYLNICGVHKSFLNDLFEHHTMHMTKAHTKQRQKALSEFEWTFKLTEKLRCMYHFAGIPKEVQIAQPPPVIPPRESIDWALLQESQAAELPEFDRMLSHYMAAIHDARREFYVQKDATRVTRIQSGAFLVFVTVTDVLISLM
ncbi:hypothetical protein SPRG_00292 [Saprolegnia parasitica CBS 223.65]|uniref:EF-hand domain-containing protein n=1 Tax=Saprolegnia parasitica (strain CBS 223.65) TaxID=695850 RepID=A0A067CXK3_SAPPC|nr:hypothetical protein SPRG_00292 [Saprolegnia parasitica CBS 223.65]KDO35444.1 hypothetical protein SPRG_00292 [Saprolegnia parasitica CBS 223.65]|eukprot:XP_012193784.1 hypothetical protein SPRG_00292 [Saprolegnia parasitica CBS 223.65]